MNNYEPMSIAKERRILAMMELASNENSAKTEVIIAMFNVKERQLREMVEKYRIAGLLICVGKGGGYFIARSWQEYRDTFKRNCNLAISALKTQYRARKQFQRAHQPTIFDDPDQDERLDLILAQIAELPDPSLPTDKAA
jgi:predicted DNA-binding transcriptional regulator YafY